MNTWSRRGCYGLVVALAAGLTGCSGLLISPDDSTCTIDLKRVEQSARDARAELASGMAVEQRQVGLSRMVEAAARARATCGYEVPDTKGARRARQPKAG
ncbi:hypothetical protein [Salinisphaera sp. T31B1]|uniref:hypothetical protein n=1 Tax=Salinisphaera sp. T31B1 TaxID=727963 RepID=UPI00334268A2